MMLVKALIISSLVLAHSWYPSECCSGKDCKPVPCEEILELNNGNLSYDGLEFTKDRVHLSQDKFCHACVASYKNRENKVQSTPRCIFIHQNT